MTLAEDPESCWTVHDVDDPVQEHHCLIGCEHGTRRIVDQPVTRASWTDQSEWGVVRDAQFDDVGTDLPIASTPDSFNRCDIVENGQPVPFPAKVRGAGWNRTTERALRQKVLAAWRGTSGEAKEGLRQNRLLPLCPDSALLTRPGGQRTIRARRVRAPERRQGQSYRATVNFAAASFQS